MNIVFVCQQGELELKSLLLAWSLRKYLGENVRLVAACPEYKHWGDISSVTRDCLSVLNVSLKYFAPAFGDTYPIGNKISALALLPENEPGCFLDSDMLCVAPWTIEQVLQGSQSAAKPADMGTWGDIESWQHIYSVLDVEPLNRKVRLTITETLSNPYFNAGVVASNKPQLLSQIWLQVARQLDSHLPAIENKYPWLDQISLPIAMEKTGSWSVFDEKYNYPAHLRTLADRDVALCHYHSPKVILREPKLRNLFDMALAEFPSIKPLIVAQPAWAVLCVANFPTVSFQEKKRNFLITGIPRSGTSFVSSLLDDQDNWLVVNEPAEIFSLLQNRKNASGIPLYHAECREKVLCSELIKNKVKNGKVIQDTAVLDAAEWYTPKVKTADFWLGSKNTLAYLASLSHLIKLEWPIVAMVRNPLDTISSWRNTFNHLREAIPSRLPIANPEYHGWSAAQRESLQEIDQISDERLRRVLFWRFLCGVLLDAQEKINLFRYEDVVSNPNLVIDCIGEKLNYKPTFSLSMGVFRSRESEYDAKEREMLLDLCAKELHALNYKI